MPSTGRLSLTFVIRVALVVFSVAALAQAAGLLSNDHTENFTEVFCGKPPQRSQPVVLPPHDSPLVVSISIVNFSFSPEDVTIHSGDTVMWTNNDGAAHTTSSN